VKPLWKERDDSHDELLLTLLFCRCQLSHFQCGYQNWNLVLLPLNELASRGIVDEDTSPNESRRALLSPAWAAAVKITTWKGQLPNDSFTFIDQSAAHSNDPLGGLELNQLLRH